jgi:DNA topoisomerase-6 subunit A
MADPRREVPRHPDRRLRPLHLSDDVQIELNERDVSRAKQIAAYPWFKDKKQWQKEIKQMLRNGYKMEVEALITKDISYVTEEYVPERLRRRDWLE